MSARGAGVARWWVDRYTRGLPAAVRDRRRAEIDSDVSDQLRDAGDRGVDIGWRTVRGIPSDLAWRRSVRAAQPGPSRARTTWRVATQSWFAPLAVLVGAFDLLLAWGVATEPGGKLPGRAFGPIAMGLLGIALFVGLWLRWRTAGAPSALTTPSGPRGRLVAGALALLVACLALLVVGATAGSLVLFFAGAALFVLAGLALGTALVVRAVRSASPASHAAVADAMIVVGVLPALAFFWMIVPPLVAGAVIAGVAGVGPRPRTS